MLSEKHDPPMLHNESINKTSSKDKILNYKT
jgi:hypothetical protein